MLQPMPCLLGYSQLLLYASVDITRYFDDARNVLKVKTVKIIFLY